MTFELDLESLRPVIEATVEITKANHDSHFRDFRLLS